MEVSITVLLYIYFCVILGTVFGIFHMALITWIRHSHESLKKNDLFWRIFPDIVTERHFNLVGPK